MSDPLVVPQEGQSLDGLVMAAACALGERSTIELARLAGIRWGTLPFYFAEIADLHRLAREIGLPPAELTERAYPALDDDTDRRLFNGVPVANRLIVKRSRRFCPETLRDRPWHRALWQLAPFPFCEASWRLLTDRCHACGATQRFSRAWGPELCDRCMRPLSEGATEGIPVAHHGDLRLAVGLVHHDEARRRESLDCLPDAVSRHGSGTAMTMLAALAGVVDPAIRSRNSWRLIAAEAPPDAIVDAVAAAWRMLQGWPREPLRLFDERLAPRPGTHGDGNGGATVGLLELGARYAVETGARTLVTELRGEVARRQRGALTTTEFAARTGVRVTAFASARRDGAVECLFGFKNGKPHPFYLASQADAIAEARGSCHRVETVGTRLGCPHRTVEELVATGDLDARIASVDGCASTRLRIVWTSLNSFEERIAAASSADDRLLTMPLHRAMTAIGGRLKPWSAILRDLASGTMPFSLTRSAGSMTRRVRIDPRALDLVRDTSPLFAEDDPRFQSLMSKQAAIETLNCDPRHMRPLLDRWPSMLGPQLSVPVADVVEMARRLVFLPELAVRQRTTASAMGRRLRRLGVERGDGASFSRAEVEAVLGGRES